MSTPPANVKSIFEKALELSDLAARAAYLDVACSENAALRAEVEGLLTALERAGGFLNRIPVPDAATSSFVPVDPGATAEPSDGPTGTFGSGPPETGSYSGSDGPIGTVIAGKYKLIEEIGEGGMGTVFLAQQTEPVKRLVAVKVIKAGMDSKAVLARFEAERQALAMMDHPNIARVLDAGATEDGRPFFVMELVKGVPITKFCDDRKLTPRERLELFVPVCNAIQHAHQKGVIPPRRQAEQRAGGDVR
jgi:serine/threonine-protein kinase